MDYIQEYVKECVATNFWVSNGPPDSRFFHEARMEVNERSGQGWSEILRIHNGLYVEMADYCLNQRMKTCHRNVQRPFSLGIMLSGHFDFQIPGWTKDVAAAGDVWCIQGPFEQMVYTHYSGENICGISICLPPDLIASWLGSSCCGVSKGLEKLVLGRQVCPLARGLCRSSEVMRIARALVSARRQTLSDKLHFESLALDFLAHILILKKAPLAGSRIERARLVRIAVEEAVDILCREMEEPPTISTLARRVGINECYLKKGFREQMGMTIGAYIRQLRMTKALELIETGSCSILDVAIRVGYSNPGHFSAVFKKFYGRLPSYYLPQPGKTSDGSSKEKMSPNVPGRRTVSAGEKCKIPVDW